MLHLGAIPGTALTWLTFSSISDMATVFFPSGLSFWNIIMAARLTACSNLDSVESFRTSASFSGVMPVWGETKPFSFSFTFLTQLMALFL